LLLSAVQPIDLPPSINARDIEASKKVASDAKIEVK